MKYIIIIIILLCCFSCTALAQKEFQGTASYLMVSADSNLIINISCWYKKDKIKMVTTIKKGPKTGDFKNETIIVNIKKGVIDRIKDEEKIIEREKMRGKEIKQDIPSLHPAGKTIILGHECTILTSGKFSKEEKKDSTTVTTSGEIRICYADDLLFTIPDSLKTIQMLPLLTNGHLALGSDIIIQQPGMNIALHTEAKEISAVKRLKRSDFRYPKDYKLRANE